MSISHMWQNANGISSPTDRRSAAGRARDHHSNEKDRDARPVRCSVWLCSTFRDHGEPARYKSQPSKRA